MAKLSSTYTTKELLHAYIVYQEILQAALVFAYTGENIGNMLHPHRGSCDMLLKRFVSYPLAMTLSRLHKQTSSSTYPVAGGNYWRTGNFTKWTGTYGENRRKFLADCIETLRVTLNKRGYNF